LNAKQHEREAEIVAQAGRKGMVTIATNMAGRGTDIVLGGNPDGLARQEFRGTPESRAERLITDYGLYNPAKLEKEAQERLQAEESPEICRIVVEAAAKGLDFPSLQEQLLAAYRSQFERLVEKYKPVCAAEHDEVVELGGLHILGTERHESRRIDNQLRGRSGRQGDPGSSRFYLSLQDDLLRIFGSERVAKIMDLLKIEEGEAITHVMITKSIENAQKKVEAHNFEIRKHLIDYDDVMNKQREVIYTQRREILAGEDIRTSFLDMMTDTVEDLVAAYAIDKVASSEWDWQAIGEGVYKCFGFQLDIPAETLARLNPENFKGMLLEHVQEVFDKKLAEFGDEMMDHLIKVIMLQAIDTQWKDHLLSIDHLKEGIGLRGYGQKDPKQEYKREAYQLFMDLLARTREEVVEKIFWVQLAREDDVERMEAEQQKQKRRLVLNMGDEPVAQQPAKSARTAGRNDPCPCGSGKKYKKCCGK
ncbi:MAG TPA: SEC-C metal-binding domain-containing protein, partial [Geobacteraceae bacterium]